MSPWLPTIGDSVGPIKIDSHVDELCDIPPRSEGSLCLSVSHVGDDGGASCHVLSATQRIRNGRVTMKIEKQWVANHSNEYLMSEAGEKRHW